MSKKILVDTVSSLTANTDLALEGAGSGVPNIEAGFKVGGTVGVPQASIQDQAINEAKLQVSNAPVNGYNLTAQSGNTGGLTWAEAGGGGFTHIQTIVANSTATIDFDSKLTTDFDGYLLTGFGVNGATDHAQPWLRVSTDGGSNWKYGASDYGWVLVGTLSGGGSVVGGYDYADVAYGLHGQPAQTGLRSSSSHNSQFQCYISHPMTAAFHTTFHSTLCNGHGSEAGLSHNAGSRRTAEQNNSVQFLMESGAVATGTFTLFGVNKS